MEKKSRTWSIGFRAAAQDRTQTGSHRGARRLLSAALVAALGCGEAAPEELPFIGMRSDCRTFEGDLVVESAEDLDAIAESCAVSGYLVIQNSDLDSVSLPKLREVGLELRIDSNADLEAIELPALEAVGGETQIRSNPALTRVDLAHAKLLVGGLYVTNNEALTAIDSPDLESLFGPMWVLNNERLQELSLPKLIAIDGLNNLGHLYIQRNQALQSAHLPKLALTTGKVLITDNQVLGELELNELQSVGKDMQISYNPQLGAVKLPALASLTRLVIGNNDKLSNIQLDALRMVEQISIQYNAVLESCSIGDVPSSFGSQVQEPCQ